MRVPILVQPLGLHVVIADFSTVFKHLRIILLRCIICSLEANLSTVFKHRRIKLLICILQSLEAKSIKRGVGFTNVGCYAAWNFLGNIAQCSSIIVVVQECRGYLLSLKELSDEDPFKYIAMAHTHTSSHGSFYHKYNRVLFSQECYKHIKSLNDVICTNILNCYFYTHVQFYIY